MQLPPLTEGVLIRRYKRFLADVDFGDGEAETVHCPNPGAMTGLDSPGAKCWCSTSENKTRKLPKTLEIIEADGTLVGMNTTRPNALVQEALEAGVIPEFTGRPHITREAMYEKGTRFDFKLMRADGAVLFLEVKNVHLMREAGLAEFPDSVTARGTKHLQKLTEIAAAGEAGAAMLYVIQRGDCDRFAIAGDIDPAYAEAFTAAREAGVIMPAWACDVSPESISIKRAVDLLMGNP